jgi:hypothetical protein
MATPDELKAALIKKAQELDIKHTEAKAKREDFMQRMQKKMLIEMLNVQHACSHRKGISWRVMTPDIDSPNFLQFEPKLPPFTFDFCVSMHTFVDGKQLIKCIQCKREWHSGDPDFAEAYKMVLASSNKPSASERLPHVEPNTPQGAVQLVKPLRKSFWNRFFNAVKVRIREGF